MSAFNRVNRILTIALAAGLTTIGCGDGGGAPPTLPTFNFDTEGDESDADLAQDAVLEELDAESDGFAKPEGGESAEDVEEIDASESDAEGSETPEKDTAEEEDVSEELPCSEQNDPDAWCAEQLILTGCDSAYCVDNTCLIETIPAPACCVTSADCDDGNDITFDSCLGIIEGCSNQVDPTLCANNVAFLSSSFDDGTQQGWTVQDNDGNEVVGWTLDTTRTHQGSYSFYFGHESCPTYYTGEMDGDCQLPSLQEQQSEPQVGTLISPEFTIPSNSAVFLSFQVFAEFEMLLQPSAPECPPGGFDGTCWSPDWEAENTDNLSVWISYYDAEAGEEVMTELWSVVDLVSPFDEGVKGTGGEFIQVGVDLSSFADKAVRIVFEAQSDDFSSYAFEGAYVDSVTVKTGCEQVLCTLDSDCQSPDTCKSIACTSLVNSDGGFCFGEQVKENCAACPGGTHPECNDGNDCTQDLCSLDKTCSFTAIAEENCCDGGATSGPYDFENGLPPGWTADGGTETVGWTTTTTEEGDTDLYFGNPAAGNYDAGGPVSGTLTTGFFNLPLASYSILATMELKLATEYEIQEYQPGAPALDQLKVFVLSNMDGQEMKTLVLDSLADLGGATGVQQGKGTAVYENIGFDLTPWQDQSIRLQFTFETFDGASNDFAGIFVDNLTFVEICEEPGCTLDADCDDGFGCTTDSCLQGFCVSSKEDPLCCESDSECNDGNPCTNDSCVDAIGCVNEPVADPTCCFEAESTVADFEGSDFGWEFDSISQNVVWSFQTGASANGGNGFLYFGDPELGSYQALEGTISTGTAVSPPFPVAVNGGTALQFDLFMETEWDEFPNPCDENCLSLLAVNDVLTISVRDQFFVDTKVWSSDVLNNTTGGEYVTLELNLSDWAGEDIQIVYEFKTTDELFNDKQGVRIDNMGTYVVCSDTFECFSDFDCLDVDGDECTTPVCTNNTCSEEEILLLPDCCFETPIMSTNFDSGTWEGFTFTGLTCGPDTFTEECFQNDNAEVKWQLSTLQSYSPNHSLWFGNMVTESYEQEGLAVAGWATSKEVSLFDGLSAELDMWVYLDVESFNASIPTDRFEVIIAPEFGQEVVVWGKGDMVPADMGNWVNVVADLSDFSGQTIQVKVEFDSYDNQLNSALGVFVDDVDVIQGCTPIQ